MSGMTVSAGVATAIGTAYLDFPTEATGEMAPGWPVQAIRRYVNVIDIDVTFLLCM